MELHGLSFLYLKLFPFKAKLLLPTLTKLVNNQTNCRIALEILGENMDMSVIYLAVIKVGLVFSISIFFITKTFLANKRKRKKYLLAVIQL